ncbi:MAG: hypothetical protein ACK5PT_10905, partial [Cereibacter sp.]
APDPAGGKRPPVAGRALAGGFGPRLDTGQRGAVAGAMAPAMATVKVPSPSPGGNRKRTAFPPPVLDGALQTGTYMSNEGQRPTRRARSARRGRGGRWPGALGPPRLGKGQRSTVAKAMAPASQAVKALSSVRAGRGNATRVSPAPARQCGKDRLTLRDAGQRPTRRARSARRWRGGRVAR